jgi:hypothetical protein
MMSDELLMRQRAALTSWHDRPGGPLLQAQFHAELTGTELGL